MALAAYRYVRKLYNTDGSLLIQHGSYQWISVEDQPHVEDGEVLLYRGIGQATLFRCLRFQQRSNTRGAEGSRLIANGGKYDIDIITQVRFLLRNLAGERRANAIRGSAEG